MLVCEWLVRLPAWQISGFLNVVGDSPASLLHVSIKDQALKLSQNLQDEKYVLQRNSVVYKKNKKLIDSALITTGELICSSYQM